MCNEGCLFVVLKLSVWDLVGFFPHLYQLSETIEVPNMRPDRHTAV